MARILILIALLGFINFSQAYSEEKPQWLKELPTQSDLEKINDTEFKLFDLLFSTTKRFENRLFIHSTMLKDQRQWNDDSIKEFAKEKHENIKLKKKVDELEQRLNQVEINFQTYLPPQFKPAED
jgi:hypothetical protein